MNSHAHRLAEVLNQSLKILEPLQAVPELHEELRTLLAESTHDRLRIGVVGVTSSGKSTFINALLGESILPEDSIATTNVPVICRWGRERRVLVSFEGLAGAPPHLRTYEGHKVTPDLLRSLCSEMGNPGNTRHVRRVELELPTCCLPASLEMIDTPGTDSGVSDHEETTLRQCLPIADIVVFMTTIQRRIQQSEATLLRNVIDRDQRVIFILSRADTEKDDEWGRGRERQAKAKKLQDRVDFVADVLKTFTNLRDSGIFPVASLLAQEARGDRSSEKWRASNFEAVVTCLEEYGRSLETLLVSSRIERTCAVIESVRKRIEEQKERLLDQFQEARRSAKQRSDLLQQKEREMRNAVEAAQSKFEECFGGDKKLAEANSILASVSELSPTSAQQALDRWNRQWDHAVADQKGDLDRLRGRLTDILTVDLSDWRLQPARKQLQQMALNLDKPPSASKFTTTEYRTYWVEVPRQSWTGFNLRDRLFGKKREERTEPITTVTVSELRSWMRKHVQDSVQRVRSFVTGQCQIFLQLYVEPVTTEVQQDLTRSRIVAGRADLTEMLWDITEQLKTLHSEYFSDHAREILIESRRPVQVSSDVPKRGRMILAGSPIAAVIGNAWHSIAIQRFVTVAANASGLSMPQRILVLGPPESVLELTGFLTRSGANRRFVDGPESPQSAAVVSNVVRRPHGNVEIRRFNSPDPPPDLLETECQAACAIGVSFEAGQPSMGMALLSRTSYFGLLGKWASKVFLFCGDGAVFDTRLADLTTQVAPLVAEKTGWGWRPWFIYEASTIDARYTDFLDASAEVIRYGGTDRDFVRRWKKACLPTRQPFSEKSLAASFAAIKIIKER